MKRIIISVVAVTGLVLAAASSHASLTTVNGVWGVNGAGGEWNLYDSPSGSSPGNGVMEYVYGISHFTRVDDAGDKLWAGSPGGVTFDAVYSADAQALYTGTPGTGTPNSALILSEAAGNTGTPSRSGSVVNFNPVAQPFLFLDHGTGTYNTFAYSDPALTTITGPGTSGLNGMDRMVTFAVTGYLATPGNQSTWTAFSDGKTHYVLGFEDGVDFDFNDLVVEVSGVSPVPEPTTMIAGALLLLPFGASTLRMLRRRTS